MPGNNKSTQGTERLLNNSKDRQVSFLSQPTNDSINRPTLSLGAPLLILDVNISKQRCSRLVIRQGDHWPTVVERFCLDNDIIPGSKKKERLWEEVAKSFALR